MKNLFKALAEFQQECPPIHEGSDTKHYSYASLTDILEVINPLLKKNKLGFTQPINGNIIKTILFHESGEILESEIEVPTGIQLQGMNHFQVMGSAITYLRRYAISSMLGIVTDKDVDANGATKAGFNNQAKQAPPAFDYKVWKDTLDSLPTKADVVALYKANTAIVDANIELKKLFTVRQEQIKSGK